MLLNFVREVGFISALRLFFCCRFFVLILFSAGSFGSPSTPSIFMGPSVIDQKPVEISIKKGQRGTVVVFLSARCPCSASHEVALKEYFREFAGKGFQFIGVHSNRDEAAEMTAKHFMESSLPFSVIEDLDQKLANALGALKTPHAYVLNSAGDVEFQGGVDDSANYANASRHYLKDALIALSEGQAPKVREVRSLGCVIKR